jgi:hypothetical protein
LVVYVKYRILCPERVVLALLPRELSLRFVAGVLIELYLSNGKVIILFKWPIILNVLTDRCGTLAEGRLLLVCGFVAV